jgi:hypothetical protein
LSTCGQVRIGIVHFLVMSTVAKYCSFPAASGEDKEESVFVTRCSFHQKASIELAM